MDTQWSMGPVWTYLSHPDLLAVQNWVHVMYLFLDTINKTGPQTIQYIKFFAGRVGYMPLGALCNCITNLWSSQVFLNHVV